MSMQNDDLVYQYAVVDSIQRINRLISPSGHFKIGKSGDDKHTTKARYADYKRWFVVYKKDDEAFIDKLEIDLIATFMKSHPSTCDNKQPDAGTHDGCCYVYLACN